MQSRLVQQCNATTKWFSPIFIEKGTALETAVADGHISSRSRNASQRNTLATGQSIHGVESNVEAGSSVVNSQDVDGVAAVLELPAGSAASRVPASHGSGTTNVREARDLALGLPVVSGDETVGAVRAGDDGQGAGAIIVAGVIGD